ncbi:MAG TPA: hypothetical protein VGL53_25485 [Bryobacteraceae bacterium]|jgi:hypothetical protein
MKRALFVLLPILAIPMFAGSPSVPARGAATESGLRSVRRVFIEKMDTNFDQDLRIQITRQFKGEMNVVLDRDMADAVIVAVTKNDKGGVGWGTLKYMGLDRNSAGTLTMVDKSGKTILWADEAGDRAPWATGILSDSGRRTLATRLVHKMKLAMQR